MSIGLYSRINNRKKNKDIIDKNAKEHYKKNKKDCVKKVAIRQKLRRQLLIDNLNEVEDDPESLFSGE